MASRSCPNVFVIGVSRGFLFAMPATAPAIILERLNSESSVEIDKGVKNKFLWSWMDQKVVLNFKDGTSIDHRLGAYFRKIAIEGKGWCELCELIVSYSSRGKSALTTHCKTEKHMNKLKNIESASMR